MLIKVHFGYLGGVRLPSTFAAAAVYGNLFSDQVHGMTVLHLWPTDLAMNTRETTTRRPVASLWRPEVGAFLDTEFALRGLERIERGANVQWVAQRWYCRPMSFSDIQRELADVEARKPREIAK